MIMRRRMRISRGGQLSIPAAIRHRWGTGTVVLEDRGDHVIIRPAPDDPIAAAEGALAAEFGHIDIAALRRAAREAEILAEERKTR
jgi:AbrB family looped-hinge helix DNA binding protein